jgi:hypothetical protein
MLVQPHLRLRKARKLRSTSNYWRSLRVYIVHYICVLMCVCRKVCSAVWGTLSYLSHLPATDLSRMLGFPCSLEAILLWIFLWRWNFPVSWHQYQFRFLPIDEVSWIGFPRIQATSVVWVPPECWVFLRRARRYPCYGISLGFSRASSFRCMRIALAFYFSSNNEELYS